jgi:hypothetical protein
MGVIYSHRKSVLRIMMFLNVIICLVYGYTNEQSVVVMGILLFLFPLLCIHLIITIIGHVTENKVLNWICLIFSLAVLITSSYCTLNLT